MCTFLTSLAIALIGVVMQYYIARENRKQLKEQIDKNYEVQNLITNRSATSFIADKRQKWIDELRQDISLHLALSREISLKWDNIRQLAQEKTRQNPVEKEKILQEIAEEFSKENGDRYVRHEQQHLRIKFRLNPKEDTHIKLREELDKIRDNLSEIINIKSEEESDKLYRKLDEIINKVISYTEKILKQEWDRIKHEVKYPNEIIDKQV